MAFGDPTYDELVEWCGELRYLLDELTEFAELSDEDKARFWKYQSYLCPSPERWLAKVDDYLSQPAWMNPVVIV